MKCRKCPKDYPEPDMIDGTAFFVCVNCGHLLELKNYRVYTIEERVEMFEQQYGVKLPPEYISYAGRNESWIVKLPQAHEPYTRYYFGDGFYTIGYFAYIEPGDSHSIFDSKHLSETWNLPDKLVLLDGDGHTWLALDYRESSIDPKVIVIESDGSNFLIVAESFSDFINMLQLYENVFDLNGELIEVNT